MATPDEHRRLKRTLLLASVSRDLSRLCRTIELPPPSRRGSVPHVHGPFAGVSSGATRRLRAARRMALRTANGLVGWRDRNLRSVTSCR